MRSTLAWTPLPVLDRLHRCIISGMLLGGGPAGIAGMLALDQAVSSLSSQEGPHPRPSRLPDYQSG